MKKLDFVAKVAPLNLQSEFSYRREIDGLRCIAVLGVILFHVKKNYLPGGYLGVDVFFVISGFLITSIILRGLSDNSFTLIGFFNRRVRRIVPAATFLVLSVSLVYPLLLYRPDFWNLDKQSLASLFSYANVYFWFNTADYWSNAGVGTSPLLHYWSLSVEEQYYLVYPLLLVLVFNKFRFRIEFVIGAVVVCSFSLFAFAATRYPEFAFYLPFARSWELGVGCLVAIWSGRRRRKGSGYGTLVGVLLIFLAFIFPHAEHQNIGYETVLAIVGTCLVIVSGSNRVSRWALENKASLYIGKTSYSLYLWHWPVLVALQMLRSYGIIESLFLYISLFVLILLLCGTASFYFVERPFRKWRHGSVAALIAVLVVAVYSATLGRGYVKSIYPSDFITPISSIPLYDVAPQKTDGLAPSWMRQDAGFIAAEVAFQFPARIASQSAYLEGGIIRQRDELQPRILLIGDSHATMIGIAVDNVTEKLGITTSFLTMGGENICMTVPVTARSGGTLTSDERLQFDQSRLDKLRKWQPEIVIVACRWDLMPAGAADEFFDYLSDTAGHVILVESPPKLGQVGDRAFYQYLTYLGGKPSSVENGALTWDKVSLDEIHGMRRNLKRMAFSRARFSLLPIADIFMTSNGVNVATGKYVFYYDDDHLTDRGANLIENRLTTAIMNVISGRSDKFPLVSKPGPQARRVLDIVALPESIEPVRSLPGNAEDSLIDPSVLESKSSDVDKESGSV